MATLESMIHAIVDPKSPTQNQQQQAQQNATPAEQHRQAYLQDLTVEAALSQNAESSAAPKSPKSSQKRSYTKSPRPPTGGIPSDSGHEQQQQKKPTMTQSEEHAAAMEIHRQIIEYMDSPYFKDLLGDFERPKPPPINNYQTLLSMKNTLKAVLLKGHRTMFVEQMFQYALVGTEFSLVELAKQSHFTGLTSVALQAQGAPDAHGRRQPYFQPELEEIAIELSNNWIPDPKVRLAFKLVGLLSNIHAAHKMQEQFQNQNPNMYRNTPPEPNQQGEAYYPTETTVYDDRSGEEAGSRTYSQASNIHQQVRFQQQDGDNNNNSSSPSYTPSSSSQSSSNYFPATENSIFPQSSSSSSSSTNIASQSGSGQQNNIFSNLRQATSDLTSNRQGRRNFSRPFAAARKQEAAGGYRGRSEGTEEDEIAIPTSLGNFDPSFP